MQEREQNLLLEVVEGSQGPVFQKMQLVSGLDLYEIPTKDDDDAGILTNC